MIPNRSDADYHFHFVCNNKIFNPKRGRMKDTKKMVKQETMLIAVFITLVIGFILGVVFAVYKLDSMPGVPSQQTVKNASGQPNMTDKQAQILQNLQTALKNNPKDFQALIQQGNLYFDTGQPDKAIKAYTESLKYHQGSSNLSTDLGIMYRRTKQFDKALEMFNKAISMDSSHEPARLNKGIVLMYDLQKPEEAIKIWEQLLSINPNAKTGNGDSIADFVEHIKKTMASDEAQK